jgi:hypothetical protein
MKKTILLSIFSLTAIVIASLQVSGRDLSFAHLKPGVNDLPPGYVIGKIPGFAKKVIKGNPWDMDAGAIRKMSPRIYPGASIHAIKSIHMTIMAKKRTPYGDDLVCYILEFRDSTSAKAEIAKLKRYTGYNRDRTLLITRGNSALFLHVDDVDDLPVLKDFAARINRKMKSL